MLNMLKDNHKETIATASDDKQLYAQSEIVKVKAVD